MDNEKYIKAFNNKSEKNSKSLGKLVCRLQDYRLKVTIFQFVIPSSMVDINQRYSVIYCLYASNILKMEETCSFEALETYQSTQLYGVTSQKSPLFILTALIN